MNMAVFVSSLSMDEKIDLRDQLARFDFLGQLKQVDRDFAISQLTPEEMRMEKIEAIKSYRTRTGVDLRKAMDVVKAAKGLD